MSALASLMKKLIERKQGGDNNGLLASKTPSFWDLGTPPTGGYSSKTFNKVYTEFRQFRKVFGRNTGVTFKNLIMPDLIPMIREDLKLKRKQWKKLSSKELIAKLKHRMGLRQRDAYVAELEACPRLTAGIRDITVLNDKFKSLAASMLAICERARNHGVALETSSCKHVFSEAVKNCYRINQWFRLKPFVSIGASVRHINSKLNKRLAEAAEQKHENAMDDAKLNGVRSQVGDGKSESSNAPDRRKGKQKGSPKGGGIDKDKDRASRDKFAQKMDALYKIENALPKGRYWHLKTPFCPGENCTMKICQGCGTHQVEGRPWHDRPRCNCRKHPDFVENGYYHDKWPNRLSIHAKDGAKSTDAKDGGQQHSSSQHRPPRSQYSARANSAAQDGNGGSTQ